MHFGLILLLVPREEKTANVIPFLDPKNIRFRETSIKSLPYLPFFLLSLSLLGDFFKT